MTLNIAVPQTTITPILMPKITVIGVGGAGGNAVNNMIESNLQDVNFVVANTDAQSLSRSRTDCQIQMGVKLTRGLGAGTKPEVGKDAAEECRDTIRKELEGSQMVFVTAGMGGGTGTGAAPIVAQIAKELNILTVGVVTKPFNFEGQKRMGFAEEGVKLLEPCVDTLLVIPNQNLFRVINDKTSISLAFKIADDVLVSAVRSITDLMRKDAPINLDFADVSTVMSGMGRAIMGTGEAEGEDRAITAAQLAISNELLEDRSIRNAKALLVNISGGSDIGLQETEDAINTIKDELADNAGGTEDEPIFAFGLCEDPELEGKIRISVVATGIKGEKKSSVPEPLSKSRLLSEPSRPLAKTCEVSSQNSELSQITNQDEPPQLTTQTEQIRKAMADARLKINQGQNKEPIQEQSELIPKNIHSSFEENDNPNVNNVKFEIDDSEEKAESIHKPRGLLDRYRRVIGIKNKSENQQQSESDNEDAEISQAFSEKQKSIDEGFLQNGISKSKDVPEIGITLKPDIDESLSSPSDEELEIPAFLRRQAN